MEKKDKIHEKVGCWLVGWLVGWFYGTSVFVGYLTPNPLYLYIRYMICERILLIAFLNESEFICLHTIK